MNNTGGVGVVSVGGGNGGSSVSHSGGGIGDRMMSVSVVRAGVSSIGIRVSVSTVGESMAVDAGVEDGRIGLSLRVGFGFALS